MNELERFVENEGGDDAAVGESILPVPRTVSCFSKGNSLSQLVPAAKTFETKFSKYRVAIQDLRFDQEGVIHKGRLIRMDQVRRTRLFNKIGAPGNYLQGLPVRVQADALTFHAESGKFGPTPLLITADDEAVTFEWSGLTSLTDYEVLKTVAEAVGAESDFLILQKIEVTDESLNLQLVTPRKTIEVTPGDIVQSGLSINHHRFGSQATWIEAFNLRLVCSNGMTRKECAKDGLTRTRRLSDDDPANKDLQIEQIARLTEQTWRGLERQLEALRITSERPVDVETLLRSWPRQARISEKKMVPRLLAAWARAGSERTEYAAVNALTWVATHGDVAVTQRQRRLLASMAGLLAFSGVHLCDRCWSVLTAENENHAT